ncbi:MAG: hypothetical protein ACK4WD_13880 [Flavobacteriales bacterium]|jgi:hypothetical protein
MSDFKSIEQLKKEALDSYNNLLAQKKEFEVFLSKLGITDFYDEPPVVFKPSRDAQGNEVRKKTFNSIVTEALRSGDVPMRTISIMKVVNEAAGKKYERKETASRLSIASKKGEVKIFEHDISDPSQRYWWTLPEWWSEGNLNEKYVEKISNELKKASSDAS